MRRGFLFTFCVFLLLAFLVSFSVYYAAKPKSLARELSASLKAERAAFVVDDLETDVNRLLGVGLDINSGDPNTVVMISDRLPSDFNRAQLAEWKTFVETQLAPLLSSSIDLNTAGLADANAELLFNDGIQYVFAPSDANSLQLFVPGGDTNILAVDVNVYVSDDLNNSVPWVPGAGDINVTLRYSDNTPGNSFVSTGQLSSAALSQYVFRYSGDNADALTVSVGRLAGSDAAVRITHALTNFASTTRVTVKFTVANPVKPLTVSANMDLNYSQADMNLGRQPILARG